MKLVIEPIQQVIAFLGWMTVALAALAINQTRGTDYLDAILVLGAFLWVEGNTSDFKRKIGTLEKRNASLRESVEAANLLGAQTLDRNAALRRENADLLARHEAYIRATMN